jgi:cytosine/creatinine deaminase
VSAAYDVVISNVRIREAPGRQLNVGVLDGRIAAITNEVLRGRAEISGEGNLLTGSFVDAHLHLCKVYTLPTIGDEALRRYASGSMGETLIAIELAAKVKQTYTETGVYDNARRAIFEGLKHGVTHVQAFVDTDTHAKLTAMNALIRLRDEFKGIVDLKLVAFPQQGLIRDPGAEQYLRQALKCGADVVGGIPWVEHTDQEAAEHIDCVFSLAREFDRDVAMLVDDAGDPGLRTTEMLASAAIRSGWDGRITACHARAMSLYPEPYFRRLAQLAKRARVAFVTDPHTGPLHLRFAELLEAGMPVALGQDDIADAYYPYGRHNMLEVAFLASHVAGPPTFPRMDMCFDMITAQAARVLKLPGYGVALGRDANLVVLRGSTIREVLSEHAAPVYVISHGRLTVANTSQTLFLNGEESLKAGA